MSDFIKKLKAYPLRNSILLVADQQDYVYDSTTQKMLVHSNVATPVELSKQNTWISDGYHKPTEILSQDPLQMEFNKVYTNVSGYDGIVVSDDGYSVVRGEIKDYTNIEVNLYGYTAFSKLNKVWLMLGYSAEEDGYNRRVYYSDDYGETFSIQQNVPAYCESRTYADVCSDGTYFYVGSGYTSTSFATDIMRFTESDGYLNFEDSEWASDLTEYTKLAQTSNYERIYISEGYYNYAGSKTTPGDIASEGLHTPNCLFYFDDLRNMLVYSDPSTSTRIEQTIDAAGNVSDDITSSTSFIHEQSTAASTWAFTHGLGTINFGIVCYDTNGNEIIPSSAATSTTGCTINFATAVAGRACVMTSIAKNGQSWTIGANGNMWRAFGSNHLPVEHQHIDDAKIYFNTPIDGYVAVKYANVVGVQEGRYFSDNVSGTSKTSAMYHGDESMFNVRDSDGYNIKPNTIDYTYTNATATFNKSTTGVWHSWFGRHYNYLDNIEKFDESELQLKYGKHVNDNHKIFALSDGTTYNSMYTTNATTWNVTNVSDPVFDVRNQPTYFTPEVSIQSTDGYMYLSDDNGETFTQNNKISRQEIEWYGQLKDNVIDKDTKVYFSPRPCDIVWDSTYGYIPTYINDYGESRYILLYPPAITATSDGSITVSTASEQSAITLNQYKGYKLLIDQSGTKYIIDIIGNSTGGLGIDLDIYFDDDKTDVIPAIDDRIQIIHPIKKGSHYYRFINKDTEQKYVINYDDGYEAPSDVEKDSCFYNTEIVESLPHTLNTQLGLVEMQSAMSNQLLAQATNLNVDAMQMNEKQLQSLAKDLGFEHEGIDMFTLRRAVQSWYNDVDAYGACLDGISNILSTLLNQDITLTQSTADTAGNALTISISEYSNNSWTWDSSNELVYNPGNSLWYIKVDTSDIEDNIRVLKHRSILHLQSKFISVPAPIFDHTLLESGEVLLWSDDRLAQSYVNDTSVVIILEKVDAERLWAAIKIIQTILPFWVELKFD